MIDIDDIEPEEYVEENREKILTIIRRSDDPFARASAWVLLDRHTPDKSVDELQEELRTVAERGGKA
jgi:predicted Zn-ribbon and HTH transcriptional regulator